MPEPTGGSSLDRGQLQDRAVQGAAWTMLHTVISVPTAFLVNLLLARVLEPAGFGRLALLTTVITIAGSVLALGLTPAMIQFGAKAHAAGRTGAVTSLLRSAQGFRLLVVAPVLTLIVSITIDVPFALLLVAILFGVWVPAVLEGAPITLFIENKTAADARNAMVTNAIVQVGVVVVVLWIGTADSVWVARVVLGAVGVALAAVEISSRYRRVLLKPSWPVHFPSGFWRFAIPTGLAGLIGQLALQRTEVLYLTWWSTPEVVGIYALAFGLSGHIFAPAQALTGPLMPAISGLREVDASRVHEALTRTLRASGTIISLLTGAVLPALVVLVPTLYGQDFAEAGPAVLVLGLAGAVVVSADPIAAFVLARLSGRTYLVSNVIALAANIIIAIALIPFVGLWGAVAANATANIARTAVMLRSEQRDLGLGVLEILRPLAPAVLGCGACAGGWAASLAVSGPPLVEAALASLAALVLLVLALRLTGAGLRSGDVDAIARVMPGRLQGPLRLALGLMAPR